MVDRLPTGAAPQKGQGRAIDNGCDRRDMDAWRSHVDEVRAEWLTVNSP